MWGIFPPIKKHLIYQGQDDLFGLMPQNITRLNTKSHLKKSLNSKDRDTFVFMTSVIECFHACIPLTNRVNASGGDPSRKCPIQKALPGWKEDFAPLISDSLFWHAVWISAGRPKGALQHFMAWSMYKYHYAVRKAKRLANSIRAADISDAAATGDVEVS
jgi:hypothetical protein